MIKGYTFDKENVTASADASLQSYFNLDGACIIGNRGDEFSLATNGLKVTVGTGEALIQGRHVKVLSTMEVPVPANTDGYIVIEINLGNENTSEGEPGRENYTVQNNQLFLKYTDGPIQENLNNGGMIFDFALARVQSTSTSITILNQEPVYKIDYGGGLIGWLKFIRRAHEQDSGWQRCTLTSGFTDYADDQILQYRKIGKMVEIRGAIKTLSNISGSSNMNAVITTLPEQFRPAQRIIVTAIGTSNNLSMFNISPSGEVALIRYISMKDGTYTTVTNSMWIQLQAVFMVE